MDIDLWAVFRWDWVGVRGSCLQSCTWWGEQSLKKHSNSASPPAEIFPIRVLYFLICSCPRPVSPVPQHTLSNSYHSLSEYRDSAKSYVLQDEVDGWVVCEHLRLAGAAETG